MKSIKNYVAGSAVLVILALMFALAHSNVPRAVADEFKDVRVINAESMPAQVRDVDNPGRQPVHFNESYAVPAGKRLVIEYVSGLIEGHDECEVLIVALKSGTNFLHLYYPTFVGNFGFGPGDAPFKYGFSQETRAYIDQNQIVTIGFFAQAGCSAEFARASASGYLVDIQ